MLRDFIAIDFETANQEPSSVCSVGAVMVRKGQVVDTFYSLIQPEPNYYHYWCQRVHGLSQQDTDEAPVFSTVWRRLEERLTDVFFPDQATEQQEPSCLHERLSAIPFVAHNLVWLDNERGEMLDKTIFRQPLVLELQLHTVAAACGYDLQHHHHALADAEACAAIALYLL